MQKQHVKKEGDGKMEARYINPYTDFGFKYLFGTEPNKDITLELVNALLQGQETITSLTLLPTEQLGGGRGGSPFKRGICQVLGKREGVLRQ
jgi:hypothetical protein